MVGASSTDHQMGSGILNPLQPVHQSFRDAEEQRVAVVQAGTYVLHIYLQPKTTGCRLGLDIDQTRGKTVDCESSIVGHRVNLNVIGIPMHVETMCGNDLS